MRKNITRRLARIVILLLAVLFFVLVIQPAAAHATAATTSLTFKATADASVDRSHPSANFGRVSLLAINSTQLRAYVRFNLTGLSTSVTQATLRIFVKTSSAAGFQVQSVGDNLWSETLINYRNAPAVSTNPIASSGPVTAGTWVNADVTSQVHGDGRVTFALVGLDRTLLTLASRESEANAPQLVVQAALPAQNSMLWSGDMETADMTQWFAPASTYGNFNGGGIFDSGAAEASVSTDYAHAGKYSAKLTITTPSDPASGTRLFRWRESDSHSAAYYSAWFYFPKLYTPSTYWNIFQFKSKDAAGNDDPFWILNVGNRPGSGNMFLYLYYWQSGSGPTAGETGQTSYTQTVKDLPVGKWIHLEAYLQQAADFSGHITVWQDGTMIFDKSGVKTRYSDGDNQWSVNNYSSGLAPSTAAIYVDDAAISTSFIP